MKDNEHVWLRRKRRPFGAFSESVFVGSYNAVLNAIRQKQASFHRADAGEAGR
jgi:hypothetical protein